jgi:uncharacterized membrane protein YbhN (UPF0104 family)
VAVTLLLLGLLFRKVGYGATLQHLRDIRPVTGFLGLLILCATTAVASRRWDIILRSAGQSFTTLALFRFNLIGLFFNQALPSAIGGDGVRMWLLYRQGCSFAQSFNSVFIDRLSGFVVLAVMSLYGLPILAERLFAVPKGQIIAGIVISSIALGALFFGLVGARAHIARFRFGRFVAQTIADLLFLARRPRVSAVIAVLSIGIHMANFVVIWLVLRDLGAGVSFLGVMIVAPVVFLLLVLPVSISGWGLREGLFVVGFGLLNVPQDLALAASILYGLINLATSLIGGAIWIAEPGLSRKPMMHRKASTEPSLAEPPVERV